MVKGIIEASALYGLEQVQGPEAGGKRWVPLNHTEAIKKLESKVYHVEGELIRLRNSIERELRGKGIISHRFTHHNERDPRKEDFTPSGSVGSVDEIERLRARIDKVRDRLESSTIETKPTSGLVCYGIEELKK